MSIADLPHAELKIASVNEIAFDPKHNPDGTPTIDDPNKLRFGAFEPADGRDKFYIGCISFDVLRLKDGQLHRTEVGLLKFANDETRDGDGKPMPMVELFLTRNTHDSTDEAMQRVLTISRDACIVHVPMVANSIPLTQVTLPPPAQLPKRIALRSMANGKIVCAEWAGAGSLIANRETAGPWETFEVIELT